jgi:serine/threonine protein kinase
MREAAELLQLDHCNVIKCYGICLERACLIMELAAKLITVELESTTVHSLRQLIETVGELPLDLKYEALFQMANGLEYLHGKKIIHGDLKSANVLVTGETENDFEFKLADFGKAHAALTSKLTSNMSSVGKSKSQRTGTTSFEAPEVFLQKSKTSKSDIYSYAMVMYELLFPNYNYPWESVFSIGGPDTIAFAIIDAVKKGERPVLTEKSAYTDLISNCWDAEPSNRPNSSELKQRIVSLRVNLKFCLNL